MVNSQLQKEISDAFKIDERIEKIPSAIPVCEVNPKVVKNGFAYVGTATNATSSIIVTTPTTGVFYITGLALTIIKDATATSTVTNISGIIDGQTKILISLPSITLTAQSISISISLIHPIKIDSGTNISVLNGTNVANITAKACIYGFLDEII